MKTMNIAEMMMLEEVKNVTLNPEMKEMKKVTELRQLASFLYQEYMKLSQQKEEIIPQRQEVDYPAAKSGYEMPVDDEGYAASLLQAEQYIPEDKQPQPAKKAVKPVTQTKVLQSTTQSKEKPMKKEAIIVEVHSKDEFVNAVQKAMNEGTILTPQGKPSGINCVVSEKGLHIAVEFVVAKKDDRGIVVKYYLPENFKASDFVKHFATMMLKNAELMKRSVFNMSVSPRIYDMLKKQVIPAKELAVKGKSSFPIIVKEVEGKAVMMLKDSLKRENEVLVSVTKN